jgi:hypothetical protein
VLDEGVLALVADGCVKGIAFHLQISPQRVHQIIANDPFAAYMRVHRALAATCPARAQQMADRFNRAHDELMALRRRGEAPATGEALGRATAEGVDVIKAELAGLSIEERKRETIEHMRALWLYYDSLVAEEERERAGVR